jgi:hypothetical protein
VGTYHVLIVVVEVNARLLSSLPLRGDRAVDVGLVDDLRDHLRPVLEQIGARRGDLGAVDGICRRILEQQRDQRAEGVEEEGNDHEADHEEGDGSMPHGDGSSRNCWDIGERDSSRSPVGVKGRQKRFDGDIEERRGRGGRGGRGGWIEVQVAVTIANWLVLGTGLKRPAEN